MDTKICIVCKEKKPISAFSKNNSRKDKLHYRCKPCDAKKAREWQQNNPERAAEQNRRDRKKNLEKYRQMDRDRYYNNKETALLQRKEYYFNNKDVILRRVSNWAEKNKDKTRSYLRKNYRDNKAKYMAKSATRRASKLFATPVWLNAIERAQIQEMYDVALALTTQTGIKHHVDHIHPLAGNGFSGLHVPWNMRVITAQGNLSKGNRLPAEDQHLAWGA